MFNKKDLSILQIAFSYFYLNRYIATVFPCIERSLISLIRHVLLNQRNHGATNLSGISPGATKPCQTRFLKFKLKGPPRKIWNIFIRCGSHNTWSSLLLNKSRSKNGHFDPCTRKSCKKQSILLKHFIIRGFNLQETLDPFTNLMLFYHRSTYH